jgi:hypothetical protein
MQENTNVLKSSEITTRLFGEIANLPETDRQNLINALYEREQHNFDVNRRHPRKPSKIPADCLIGNLSFKHIIQNISRSGAFIETELPFLNNKALSMTFSLPGDEVQIKTAGKIVRTDSKGIGVQFEEVLPDPYIT